MRYIFTLGILLSLYACHTNCARILGLFAFPSQSHFNSVQSLMTALAKKDHNITTVGSFRLGEKLNNYEEIIIPQFDFWTDVQHGLGVNNMFEAGRASSSSMHKALRAAGASLTDYFLQQPKVKELLTSVDSFHYDLIIVDLFHTEALLMIGEVFKKPIIAISSSNFENYMTTLVDYSVPSACSPIDFQTYTQETSFFERISNIFECAEHRSQRKKDLIAQDKIAKKHFSRFNPSLPPLSKVQGQVSVILLNNYAPILTPRPTLVNIIPVGGLHIKPAQDIQWNIKRFLDDARDGAIYLSLGTTLKCSDLPEEKLNTIVTVLKKLKTNVLWHCDVEKIEGLPNNVLLQKIVSSSDVLAHPHVKYFVTSGGLLSLQEAVNRNIPILGIPVFRDQHLNVQNIEHLGLGIKLDFNNLTENSLTWAVEKLLTDRSYVANAREISSQFRDRPLGSVQTSLFWIEHVLRHNGAPHLVTKGTDIPWYQLYLLDVISLLILSKVCILIVGFMAYRVGGIFYKKLQHGLGVNNMFEAGRASSSSMHKALRAAGASLTDYFLQQPKVKELLTSVDSFHYDLIIVDLFHTEALLMIGEVFKKPIIAISSSNFENYMTTLVDYSVPSACSPIDFQTYTQETSFFERISNIFECAEHRSQRKKDLIAQDKIAKKHFSRFNPSLPPLSKVQGQVSVILLNNYAPILTPRPTLVNIIPVGGLHIKPAQDIQWNIKRFLDDARDGAIYLSLGTTLKCSDLPEEKLNTIVTVLKKLKTNVLWHCDVEKIEGLPNNVLLQKIVSSSDVLAHPHVKYFVTSGGLLSLQEAVNRNIPILGIPVFRDQHLNVQNIEHLGLGIKLDFNNLTENSLTWAVEKLLTDRSYVANAREISSQFRDRPLGSVQTSLFWIEHVLRHNGAPHLVTKGTDIPWYQLYLLDVISLLILSKVCILIVGFMAYRVGGIFYKKREANKLYSKLR